MANPFVEKSKSLKYVKELHEALNKLKVVKENLVKLEAQEEELKNSIKKWMDINDVEKYEVAIGNDEWSISKSSASRKNITDWAVLESVLEQANMSHIVAVNSFPKFNCGIRKK